MDPGAEEKFRTGRALCPHADACPGCPLIDLGYPEQLAHKREQVRAAFAPYSELAALTPDVTEPAPARVGYRRRAKLVAHGPRLGLYAGAAHQVQDLPHCQVLAPRLAAVVAALRALLPAEPLLAGVDAALVEERVLVTLIAREDTAEAALRDLSARLCARCPEVAGVFATRRAEGAVQLLAGGHSRLSGEEELRARETPGGPYHYVAPGAFLQAHAGVAQRIYDALAARVWALGSRAPRVLELFAGSGALALALAARGAHVIAVESYGPACARLSRAAEEQGLAVRVVHAEAERALAQLREQGERVDAVLANPPRRGLSPALRQRIAALAPAALGYVSCRPSTLARDLAHFVRLGLAPESARPLDMMPLTDQVETLVWLTPKPWSGCTVAAESGDRLLLDKLPFVTLDELTAQVRVRSGWAAALPLVALSAQASGQICFAQERLGRDEGARRDAHTFHALARGVLRASGKITLRPGGLVRYERERVIAGHSLLRVYAADEDSVRRALSLLSHPLLGDVRADRASARHFAERHGLERRFLHLTRLASSVCGTCEARDSALAPDLAAVLASLSARAVGVGDAQAR